MTTHASTDTVPVIDIAPWRTGDEVGGAGAAAGAAAARAAVARAVDAAARGSGFWQIVGHGVDPELVARVRAVTGDYFAQPLHEKLRHRPPSAEINRGYAPRGSESLSYSLGVARPPDLFEAFNVGEEGWPRGQSGYEARRHDLFAPNIWPSQPADFRDAVWAYFEAARSVAITLTKIFSAALGMGNDFFTPFIDHSTNVLRILRYQTTPDDPELVAHQVGHGAHSDYGICTVLFADPVPGLQILAADGTWHDVVPEPGALVVNIGDLLAQWTNDEWRSTLHRVIPPERLADRVNERRSMAFFCDGNHDALVAPLPTCVSPDRPARYAPVLAGEHLMNKLLGPRLHQVSTAADTAGDRLGSALADNA